MKDGELLSSVYTEWVRSQPCSSCSRAGRSEQNHAPTRGANGCINDLRSHPACRRCHIRCTGGTLFEGGKRLGPISLDQQEHWVRETFFGFLGRAPWRDVERVLADVRVWRENRVYVEIPS
jgi:hypothetical protein